MVDGTTVTQHFWFFQGSLSNLRFATTVFDRETATVRLDRTPYEYRRD